MDTVRSTTVALLGAMLLVGWLMSGCKEAVAPIEPPHVHGHGDESGDRRRAPELPERDDPGRMRTPLPEGVVPDLDEAVRESQSSESFEVEGGIRKLGRILRDGSAAQRAVALGALRDILRGEDEYVKRHAATALTNRLDETCPLLFEMLDGEDTELVVSIIDIFSRSESNPAMVKQIRRMLGHADPDVRHAAGSAVVKQLVTSGDVAGLAGLLGVYETDLSAKAAIELTVIGRETVPTLIRVLQTSPDAGQRHGAAMVLAMVCAGTSPKQEKFSELALATIYERIDHPKPADRRAVEPLIHAVGHDESELVREIAAQGLGYLGDARAAPVLADALTNDACEAVRRRAAAALILIPGERARDALEKALRDDQSEHVRRYAAEALGWIGGAAVVPALITAAEDESVEVRRYAAVELGAIAEEEQLPDQLRGDALIALVALFDDEDSDVRWAAVMAVGKMRDRAAVGHLRKALDDPATVVSHAAERGLQKLGLAERRAEEFER